MLPLIIGAAVAAHAAYKYLTREEPKPEPDWYVNVGWEGSITGKLPPAVVRPILHHHLTTEGKYGRAEPQGGNDRYFRGDASITQVPCSRPVRWIDLPMFLEVGYSGDASSCEIAVKFLAWEGVRFMNKPAVDFFHEHAADELDSFLQALRAYSPPPEPPRPEPKAEPDDADLALLGLKRGARWPDVQAAYRDACLKYHPDRLSGHSMPPHLVELAVARFREVTDAYQRLKAKLA